jgi:hypothetical protein
MAPWILTIAATSEALQQPGQYDKEAAVQLAISHACVPLILGKPKLLPDFTMMCELGGSCFVT